MALFARCVAAAFVFASSPATAATITQSFDLSGTVEPQPFVYGVDVARPVEATFDRGLGTLTAIDVEYRFDVGYRAVVTNPSAESGGCVGADGDLDSFVHLGGLSWDDDAGGPGSIDSLFGFSSCPGAGEAEVFEDSFTRLYARTFVAGQDFVAEDFYGGAASAFGLDLAFSTDFEGAENLDLLMAFAFDADLVLTYVYEPASAVPEPGAIALLGFGIVGLGLRRRHDRTCRNG